MAKFSLKNLITEYKQVKWPSLQTTINLAIFVLLVSVIITSVILGLDALFFRLRSILMNK